MKLKLDQSAPLGIFFCLVLFFCRNQILAETHGLKSMVSIVRTYMNATLYVGRVLCMYDNIIIIHVIYVSSMHVCVL